MNETNGASAHAEWLARERELAARKDLIESAPEAAADEKATDYEIAKSFIRSEDLRWCEVRVQKGGYPRWVRFWLYLDAFNLDEFERAICFVHRDDYFVDELILCHLAREYPERANWPDCRRVKECVRALGRRLETANEIVAEAASCILPELGLDDPQDEAKARGRIEKKVTEALYAI